MKLNNYDIVLANKKLYQFLENSMDSGAIIQDIHTRKELIHINLIERKANKNETKWFCENTENTDFIAPTQKIR